MSTAAMEECTEALITRCLMWQSGHIRSTSHYGILK